jgi:hypothetical protein
MNIFLFNGRYICISAVARKSKKEMPSVGEQQYRYFIYSATRQSELIEALVCSDCRIVRITGFQIKLVNLFIQNIYRYILYVEIKTFVKYYTFLL